MEKKKPCIDPMYPGELNDENIRKIFEGAGDFNVRPIYCSGHTLYTYAIDGLTAGGDISEYVFKPIAELLSGNSMEELYRKALTGVVFNSVAKACKSLDDVAMLLVNGFCVVLFQNAGAIAFEVKTGEKRGISPPDVENTAKGSKDAFVETVRSNTSLVRRHLRTPDLRLYETKVGRRSLTNVTILWIDGLTNDELVEKMKTRLQQIDIDGLITPSSVEEYITGSRYTPFPLLQYTERTDRFCRGLLEGRVGLFVDGIPVGYLAPVDIGYLMDSPEDYGRDFISASAVRILRYGALLVDLLLPALFVAMTVHHPHWLPPNLYQVIAESKQSVPFSSTWEILGLLIAFELLQETGIHLPQSIGNSVSIIGGIVVGSAAAEAGILSPIALIAVSVAGVCGFVLPNRDLAAAVRVCRFLLTIVASIAGVVGIAAGVTVLIWHLAVLKSLGISYITPFKPGLIRKRLAANKKRSRRIRPQDEKNQK
jgi:hypothetical protein